MAALKEIKRYQKSTDLLIPRMPMLRLLREVVHDVGRSDLRMQSSAVEVLREVAETHLVSILEGLIIVGLIVGHN